MIKYNFVGPISYLVNSCEFQSIIKNILKKVYQRIRYYILTKKKDYVTNISVHTI